MQIDEPEAERAPPRRLALLDLGFRPYYLCAAFFAFAAVPAWIGILEGWVPAPASAPAVLWHAHEMVYGFALAVISGFLLTAARVWTGLPTPVGAPLAALVLHWGAARVLLFTGPAFPAALVDAAYPFVLAAVLGRVLVAARSTRNYFVIVLLCALGAANAAFHLGVAGVMMITPQTALKASLYLVLTLVVVIAGRVVPSFTANGVRGARVTVRPGLDRSALGATLLAFVADLLGGPGWVVATAALAAALLHTMRQAGWAPRATVHTPLVWILHLSHAWIPVAFTLLALAALGLVAPAAALHAFGLGAMGGMIIAMMTRTALGHTARPLVAGRTEVAAYVLVHAGAVARVFAGVAPEFGYAYVVPAAGVLWAAGFLIYFVAYLPRLARPRLDGKPG